MFVVNTFLPWFSHFLNNIWILVKFQNQRQIFIIPFSPKMWLGFLNTKTKKLIDESSGFRTQGHSCETYKTDPLQVRS